tara:strand:- start:510 stop:689 length:180 start_codon:yes stop_codon:yes gene_type:complete
MFRRKNIDKRKITLPSLEEQIKISKIVNKINVIADNHRKQLDLSMELKNSYFKPIVESN